MASTLVEYSWFKDLEQLSVLPEDLIDSFVTKIQSHYINDFPLLEEEIPQGCDPYRNILCFCEAGSLYGLIQELGQSPFQSLPLLEKQPASKKECLELYGREADLPYSDFVRNSFQTMHSDWEYLVTEDSLMEFQKILLEFNSFENMYLREIYPYLQKLESKGCSENWFEWCKSAIDLAKLRSDGTSL